MPGFELSSDAELDLDSIFDYTLATWGVRQAGRYLEELENCFRLLAGNQQIGVPHAGAIPGLRRFEHGKHSIFYAQPGERIRIVRILHQRMVPDLSWE